MKRNAIIGLIMSLAATSAMAQPPEEVPPPPPDAGVIEPAPSAPPGAPVAEPQTVVPAPKTPEAAVEDARLKGVVLAPSVSILPLGYDSIDIGGDQEGGRYYFALAPSIKLNTAFKTEKDKKIDFSLGYDFRWREYYNKLTTTRDIDNTLSGSMAMNWTPIFSTSVDALADYFFKAGQDTNADNNLYIEANPTMGFKVSDDISFKAGYQFVYLALFNAKLGPGDINSATDLPSDLDDLHRGIFASDTTGFNNFDTPPTDLFSGGAVSADTFPSDNMVAAYNRAVLGASYSPLKGTSLGLTYKYEFFVASNSDNDKLTGHWIAPSVSQDLPWKGGSVSLTDEMRFRKYDYRKTSSEADAPALQKFRNRATLAVGQAINDYMAFTLYYRLESNGANADDYGKWDHNHQFYTGVAFAF